MALLSERVAKMQIHIVKGSDSDSTVAEKVATVLAGLGFYGVPDHTLSCHRHPRITDMFAQDFEGKAVICVGGMSFQLPAVLDSWFRDLGKHVVIWGIPVSDKPEEIEVTVSAMRDLPSPCLVHWAPDNSDESIQEVAKAAVGYANGTSVPKGESSADWQRRLDDHRSRTPRIAN